MQTYVMGASQEFELCSFEGYGDHIGGDLMQILARLLQPKQWALSSPPHVLALRSRGLPTTLHIHHSYKDRQPLPPSHNGRGHSCVAHLIARIASDLSRGHSADYV